MKTILFVCTGNVCRSPMAEGLFRHAVRGRGDFKVLSAGVGAVDGQLASDHAVHALQEIGIDIRRPQKKLSFSANLTRPSTHTKTTSATRLAARTMFTSIVETR